MATQAEILEERKRFKSPKAKARRFLKALGTQSDKRGGIVGAGKTAAKAVAGTARRAFFGQEDQAPVASPVAPLVAPAPVATPIDGSIDRPSIAAQAPREFFPPVAPVVHETPLLPEPERGVFLGGEKVTARPEINRLVNLPPEDAVAAIRAGRDTGAPERVPAAIESVPQETIGALTKATRDNISREALFPGAREAASLGGITQLSETDKEKVARERAQAVREASTLEDKQRLRDQFRAEDRADVRRVAEGARAERIEDVRADAIIQAAQSENQQELDKIRAQGAGASDQQRLNALGRVLSSAKNIKGEIDVAAGLTAAREAGLLPAEPTSVETTTEVATPEGTATEIASIDVDGVPGVSPDEKKFNQISMALKDGKNAQGRAYTPAELELLKKSQKELRKKLGLA